MIIKYKINETDYSVNVDENSVFESGDKKVLSGPKTDITHAQPWYSKGFCVLNFNNKREHVKLRDQIKLVLNKIILSEIKYSEELSVLQDYHKVITSDENHKKIVAKTRDLFPEDFNFPIRKLIKKFEGLIGVSLTNINPFNGKRHRIIIRINRPFSNDYNPPHKDIYESLDVYNHCPKFINFWIPISGVTSKSSLPIVPSSHLISEDKIIRTREGAKIIGQKFRVRMIKKWFESNKLQRIKIRNGDVLLFTPYLIHGLALNENKNLTRISLEFRLFQKN